ncbi:MAG TPA: hypothetical protein VFR84_02315 [Candidatus Angelobacter sp.]|nr:hypothetical protein [Candidatus Angelobacter sp.]
MKHRFITDALLYTIIVCQVVACGALIRRKEFFRHWKIFSYYLFYMAGSSILSLVIVWYGSRQAYFVTYYLVDFGEAILLNLVLLEILIKVLDPFESLPGRTVARFCYWAALATCAAVAFSVLMPGGQKESSIQVALTIERTIFLVDASLLWILLVQSKGLGMTWRSALAEVAIGFVLYLTVQATTRFVESRFQNSVLISICSEVGQSAYLIALLGWIWTITHRDPALAPPSAEALARMQKLAAEDEAVPKERILAAMGLKISKPQNEEEAPQPGLSA